jgi:hypothetical protein
VGIYGVTRPEDFAVLKGAGFNLVVHAGTPAALDRADTNGLKVLATPGTTAGAGFDPVKARETVARLDRHPALWAWYLADEPDFNDVAPAEVGRARHALKAFGARKPTALALYKGDSALDYGGMADVVLVDRYPIPWLPLAHFAQHVRLARLALGRQKPLLAVIQAFDWSSFPAMVPGEGNLRPPTPEELRCMTYCALAEGANGLFYFGYDCGGWQMAEHPATWQGLTQVVQEVRARLPLFQAEHVWWPKRHAFQDHARRYNAALFSSVASVWLRARMGNELVPAGDYLLAVNTTEQAQGYAFELPWPLEGEVPVLGESRSLRVVGNWVADQFAPLAVHIYGPLPGRP